MEKWNGLEGWQRRALLPVCRWRGSMPRGWSVPHEKATSRSSHHIHSTTMGGNFGRFNLVLASSALLRPERSSFHGRSRREAFSKTSESDEAAFVPFRFVFDGCRIRGPFCVLYWPHAPPLFTLQHPGRTGQHPTQVAGARRGFLRGQSCCGGRRLGWWCVAIAAAAENTTRRGGGGAWHPRGAHRSAAVEPWFGGQRLSPSCQRALVHAPEPAALLCCWPL